MNTPPNRQYSRFIVAPDVWPTTRQECEAKATVWQTATDTSSSAADTHRTAINGLRTDGVAQSIGFEAMHAAYWRNQIEADDLTDIRSAAADLMQNVSRFSRELSKESIPSTPMPTNSWPVAPRHSPMAIVHHQRRGCTMYVLRPPMLRARSPPYREISPHDSGQYRRALAKDLGVIATATAVSGRHRPRSHSLMRLPTTLEALDAPTHLPDKRGSGASMTTESPCSNRLWRGTATLSVPPQQRRRLHHHHPRSDSRSGLPSFGGGRDICEGHLRYREVGVSAASEEGCLLQVWSTVCVWGCAIVGRQHHRRQHLRRRFRERCL